MRAHDAPAADIDELMTILQGEQISLVQFSLMRSFPKLVSNASVNLMEMAREIGHRFAVTKINLAVLSCYDDIACADPRERARAVANFQRYLNAASTFGAPIVATEAKVGNEIPEAVHDTKHYALARESVLQMVETAESLGVDVGIEPSFKHPLFCVDRMATLIDEVRSSRLRVVLDISNLVYQGTSQSPESITYDALARLGDNIAVIHVKDVVFDGVQKSVVPLGQGMIPLKLLIQFAKAHPTIPLIIDNQPVKMFKQNQEFIDQLL